MGKRNIIIDVDTEDNVSIHKLLKSSFIGVITKDLNLYYILRLGEDEFILAKYGETNLSKYTRFKSIEKCLRLASVLHAYDFDHESQLFNWLEIGWSE